MSDQRDTTTTMDEHTTTTSVANNRCLPATPSAGPLQQLDAPDHRRTFSSDSSEGLVLSVSDLPAGNQHLNNNNNNNSIHPDVICRVKESLFPAVEGSPCCTARPLSSATGIMGQTGIKIVKPLDHQASDDLESSIEMGKDVAADEADGTCSSLTSTTSAMSQQLLRLEAELASARKSIVAKDLEIEKLTKIREEVESELHDLTASLFQEAHKMVQDANVKAASAERSLHEADLKIDGLETEVAALKTLVLASTPARPNSSSVRHGAKRGSDLRAIGSRPSSASSSQLASSPALNGSMLQTSGVSSQTKNGGSGTIIIGAGGLLGAKAEDILMESESGSNCCGCCQGGNEVEAEKHIDPDLRRDFLAWKKDPSFDRKASDFLQRLYNEEIDLCLDFPNKTLSLVLRKAVEANSLCINPLVAKDYEDESLPKNCALFEAPILCRFHVRILPTDDGEAELPSGDDSLKDFYICQLARNRIIAVCDCLTYLRYIKQGMVKSHHNEVYWQVQEYRKKMALARLGFSPD